MTLNYAYHLQPWISVSVQNAYPLNRNSMHIRSRKKIFKKHVAGIGIFQEKWDIYSVADTLAPRIASSSVLINDTKISFLWKVTIMHAHDCSLTDII